MTTWLLTACNDAPGINRWLRSLPKLGDHIKPVICMYKPYFEVPDSTRVFYQDEEFPENPVATRFHDRKYRPLEAFVEARVDDHYFVTDTLDVVYQRPLAELPTGRWGFFASEGTTFREAPYWQHALEGPFEGLKDQVIYNAGLYIVHGQCLLELWDQIRLYSNSVDETVDQLALNRYLGQRKPGRSWWEQWDDELLVLYDRMDEVDIRGGKFYNKKTGKLYAAVHANGSMKRILDGVCPF